MEWRFLPQVKDYYLAKQLLLRNVLVSWIST